MGYYIDTPTMGSNLKADDLIFNYGAETFTGDYDDIPTGKTAVCVISNWLFDAAGIAYNKDEFKALTDPTDPRPKTVLLLNTSTVTELCPEVIEVL